MKLSERINCSIRGIYVDSVSSFMMCPNTQGESGKDFVCCPECDRINQSSSAFIAFIKTTKMLQMILAFLLYAHGHMSMVFPGSIGDFRPTMLRETEYEQSFEHDGNDAGDDLERFLQSIEEDEAHSCITYTYDGPGSCKYHCTGVPYTFERESLGQHIPNLHFNGQHRKEASYTQRDDPKQHDVAKDFVPKHDVQTGEFLKRKYIDLSYESTLPTHGEGLPEKRSLLSTALPINQNRALPRQTVSEVLSVENTPDCSILDSENSWCMKEYVTRDVGSEHEHEGSISSDTTTSNFCKIQSPNFPNLVCASASMILSEKLSSDIMASGSKILSLEEMKVFEKIWTKQTLIPFVYGLLLKNPLFGIWKRTMKLTCYILVYYHKEYLHSTGSIDQDSIAIFLVCHAKMLHEICDVEIRSKELTSKMKDQLKKFAKRYKYKEPHKWICDIFLLIHDHERFEMKFIKNHTQYRTRVVSGYVANLWRSHIEHISEPYQRKNQENSVFKKWIEKSNQIEEVFGRVEIPHARCLVNRKYMDRPVLLTWESSLFTNGCVSPDRRISEIWQPQFEYLHSSSENNKPSPVHSKYGIHGVSHGLHYFMHKHSMDHSLSSVSSFDPKLIASFYGCIRSGDDSKLFWEEFRVRHTNGGEFILDENNVKE